jgi:hypothetical protein
MPTTPRGHASARVKAAQMHAQWKCLNRWYLQPGARESKNTSITPPVARVEKCGRRGITALPPLAQCSHRSHVPSISLSLLTLCMCHRFLPRPLRRQGYPRDGRQREPLPSATTRRATFLARRHRLVRARCRLSVARRPTQ